MFTRVTDASKVAFAYLVAFLKNLGFQMIDCQVKTEHLINFGAREIPRKKFLQQLEKTLEFSKISAKWEMDAKLVRDLILQRR